MSNSTHFNGLYHLFSIEGVVFQNSSPLRVFIGIADWSFMLFNF